MMSEFELAQSSHSLSRTSPAVPKAGVGFAPNLYQKEDLSLPERGLGEKGIEYPKVCQYADGEPDGESHAEYRRILFQIFFHDLISSHHTPYCSHS